MRVVIAGSSGLIGSALVAPLRRSGHDVIRLVRRTPSAPDEYGWDPSAGRIDAGALDGADAVVNLCGAGLGDRRWSESRKQELLNSRVVPTSVLAEAAAARGLDVLVNASAVGYYGHTGHAVVDETSDPGTGFLANLCQRWEQSTAPAAEGGVRVVLARTGLVLAPAGGLLGQLRPLFTALLGGRLGDGSQYMPWISLDDEVRALQFALESPEVSGPVNLTGPAPVTNAEFTRAFGDAVGRPAPWVVPRFALRALIGEFADEGLLSGQRTVPAVLERHGFTFHHPALADALGRATGG